jgi:hypothetical protein
MQLFTNTFYVMKNILLMLSVSFLVFSCGPSEEEVKANEEKKAIETQKLDAEFDQDIDAMLNDGAAADSTKK